MESNQVNFSQSAKVLGFLRCVGVNSFLRDNVTQTVAQMLNDGDNCFDQIGAVHSFVNDMEAFFKAFQFQANVLSSSPSVDEVLNIYRLGDLHNMPYQHINAMLFEEFSYNQDMLDFILRVSNNTYKGNNYLLQ